MQDTSPSPTNPELNLQFVLDASPVAMLVFNHREEVILTMRPHIGCSTLPPTPGDHGSAAIVSGAPTVSKGSLGCGHSPLCPVCPLLGSANNPCRRQQKAWKERRSLNADRRLPVLDPLQDHPPEYLRQACRPARPGRHYGQRALRAAICRAVSGNAQRLCTTRDTLR